MKNMYLSYVASLLFGAGLMFFVNDLEVSGFTQLGDNAPYIKTKLLTGTTASTEGGSVSISHGLNLNSILSVSVLVNSGSQNTVFRNPPSYNPEVMDEHGLEYSYYIDQSEIVIILHQNNSEAITSKSFSAFIVYSPSTGIL